MFLPQSVAPVAYSGKAYRFPIGLCAPIDRNMGPNSVRLTVDFSKYAINFNNPQVLINVNLLGDAVQTPLDKIRSVYIDNTDGYTTVYVYFPDTQFAVVCPPHSVTMQPVMTNGQQAQIYSAGFFFSLLPIVTVHFSNAVVSAYSIEQPLATVNAMFIGAVTGATVPGSSFTATFPNAALFPVTQTRIVAVAIATQCNVLSVVDNIFGVIIGGVAATAGPIASLIDTGGNVFTLGIFYAVVPTGSPTTVTYNTTQTCIAGAASMWALYNARNPVPFLSQSFIKSGAVVPGIVNAAAFVTKGGYCLMASLSRTTGAPQGQNWGNVFALGAFNISNLQFSVAEINGGDDDFISVNAQNSEVINLLSWN